MTDDSQGLDRFLAYAGMKAALLIHRLQLEHGTRTHCVKCVGDHGWASYMVDIAKLALDAPVGVDMTRVSMGDYTVVLKRDQEVIAAAQYITGAPVSKSVQRMLTLTMRDYLKGYAKAQKMEAAVGAMARAGRFMEHDA